MLIRCPLTVMNPWPKTCRGSGSPALISIAGQITAWKRVMSLPMTCRSAGHQRSNICRLAAEADGRGVVDERVEPDVDDARGSNGSGMPHACPARLTEMSSSPPSSRRRISLRRTSGLEELRVRREVIEQRLLILRQAEEVVLLPDPLRRRVGCSGQLAVDEILLLLERLAADAVPALVDAFVDVAGGVDALRESRSRPPCAAARSCG